MESVRCPSLNPPTPRPVVAARQVHLAWSGPHSDVLNWAVEGLVRAGAVVVVAGGNANYERAGCAREGPGKAGRRAVASDPCAPPSTQPPPPHPTPPFLTRVLSVRRYEASACHASSPTSAYGVVVAGASDASGAPAPWSWNASCFTAYAPGVGVGGRSGSSPATALVAGAVALLLSAVPCYTPADVRALLLLAAPGVVDVGRLADARVGVACSPGGGAYASSLAGRPSVVGILGSGESTSPSDDAAYVVQDSGYGFPFDSAIVSDTRFTYVDHQGNAAGASVALSTTFMVIYFVTPGSGVAAAAELIIAEANGNLLDPSGYAFGQRGVGANGQWAGAGLVWRPRGNTPLYILEGYMHSPTQTWIGGMQFAYSGGLLTGCGQTRYGAVNVYPSSITGQSSSVLAPGTCAECVAGWDCRSYLSNLTLPPQHGKGF